MNENEIEKLKKQRNRARLVNIVLVIIIILLLLCYIVSYRIGKIGYESQKVSGNIDDNQDNNGNRELIQVTQNDIRLTKDTNIDIFKNSKYGGEKIIAPKSSGECEFVLKNISKQDIIYNMSFEENMKSPINMKYRLKVNKNEYVEPEELTLDDVVVLKNATNVFKLEWYWEDDDENDTYIAIQEINEYYKLKIRINSEEYTI